MSLLSSSTASTLDEHLEVGDHVMVGGHKRGVVRFSGKTDFAPGKSFILVQLSGKTDFNAFVFHENTMITISRIETFKS